MHHNPYQMNIEFCHTLKVFAIFCYIKLIKILLHFHDRQLISEIHHVHR